MIQGWTEKLRRPPESWALLEGEKFIRAALTGWAKPLALVLRSGTEVSIPGFPETLSLQAKKFNAISRVQNSQGVLGIFDTAQGPSLESILSLKGRTWVLLSGVQDPGNVGVIIRTAAALGAAGVLADRESASPFQDKALRASAGFALVLPCARVGEARTVLEGASARGISSVAAAAHEVASQTSPAGLRGRMGGGTEKKEGPTLLVLGSEGSGLAPQVRELCQRSWTLPLEGGVESLNVAVAAALFLEARRHAQG